MKTLRIFISSPGDVAEEREKARQVVAHLQRYYGDRLALEPVLWEDLPLQADASFQDGIDLVLSSEHGIDIAVFVLWSRLGSPLGGLTRKADGSAYHSGTEREFDLMLAAREQSGGMRPDILAYVRKDDSAFHEKMRDRSTLQLEDLLKQRKLVEQFITENFRDEAGANVRAYHSYPSPVTFAERLKVHLRALLDRRLETEPGAARWTEAPYQGLKAFDIAQSPIFHGREEEIARLTGRLREREEHEGCAFVAIVGASGSGKSSLARAGVAASLLHWNLDDAIRQWRCAIYIPGDAPLQGLVRALAADGALPELRAQVADLGDLASELEISPEGAVKLGLQPAFKAAERAAGGPVRLLLVLDQLEELHTGRRLSAADRAKFLTAIEALARSGHVRVLATLRSDFYPVAQLDEAFVRLKGDRGHFDLLPPGPAGLRALIVEPARLAGLRFETDTVTGHNLADRLLEDALRQPDALPLLEYTLRELYEQRTGDLRLTFEAYDRMGGVAGAIGQRAEVVYAALGRETRDAFDETFWSLVSVSPDSEPVRRRAPLPDPDDASPRAQLLGALIRERFLSADHAGDQATASLAHEALLRSWPRLVEWVRENRQLLRIRHRVEEAAQLWREKEEHADYLLSRGLPLAEAEALLNRRRATLEKATIEFIERSSAAARVAESRRVGRLRVAVVVFAILALLACVGGWIAHREAITAAEQRTIATQEATEAEKANQENLEHLRDASVADYAVAVQRFAETGKWDDGMAHLARALRWDGSNKAAAALLWSEFATDANPAREVLRHQNLVRSVDFSPDGTKVVTASFDKTARIWDAATGKPIGQPLQHGGFVLRAVFSPDGTKIVTASEDKTARIWNAATGKPIGEPLRHGGYVIDAVFSPDGTKIVTASADKTARIWDAATGKPIGEPMQHGSIVLSAAFSPDGTKIVTASFDRTARLWDAATGAPIGEPLQHGSTVNSALFSPDGTRIVTASWDRTARIWDAATGKPIGAPLQHGDRVNSAVFSPDGTEIVTASDDKTARIWNAATGEPIGEPLQHGDRVESAVFSPDGTKIVTASADKAARIWDAATGEPIGEPLQHGAGVSSAVFSPDGTKIATASGDKTARIWDTATGEPVGEPLQHGNYVYSAVFSPDGTKIVTASGDKTARIWDAASGTPIGEPLRHGDSVNSAVFSPDGAKIVTASEDKTARIWDAATGKPIGKPLEHEDAVQSALFSPDGRKILTASGDNARIWDAATGKPIGEPLQHKGPVNRAAFSPDGTKIVTASEDKSARIWDAATGKPVGKPLQHEGGVNSALFSPDGTKIVTASEDKTARIWDAATGEPIGEPLRHGNAVNSAVFSPDGTKIVTASEDDIGRIWDAATCKPIGEQLRHGNGVNSAVFSPDGTTIVTASQDKTARIWDAATGAPIGEPLRHGDTVGSALFSPDGTKIVTASRDDTARIWNVGSETGPLVPTPPWVCDLAESIGGLRFNAESNLIPVPVEEVVRNLAQSHEGNDPWSRLARWLAAPAEKRAIDPDSTVTLREVAENERDSGTQEGLEAAIAYDPAVPLAHLLLAAFQDDPQTAAFFRDYDLKRMPDDAALWARAVQALHDQQDDARARQALDKLAKLDPAQAAKLKSSLGL